MAMKRRRITLSDNSGHELGLGMSYGEIKRVDLLSSADTSVSLAVVDDDGVTVFTAASADYTTITRRYVEVEEADVVDDAGEAAAANSQGFSGPVAKSPLTLTASGLASGTLRVDVYMEG